MRRQKITSHAGKSHHLSSHESIEVEIKSLGHSAATVELVTTPGRQRIVVYKGSTADARLVRDLVDVALMERDAIDAQALLEEHRESEGVTSLHRGRVA